MTTKSELRKHFFDQRQALTTAKVFNWSEKIKNRIIPLIEEKQGPVCLFIGMSSRNEINTLPVLIELLRRGREVWCPVVSNARKMEMAPVTNAADLDDSHPWGLIQPNQSLVRSELPVFSVILVPGLVWDLRGFRIGYGKGYYDEFLSRWGMQSLKVGLAFELQITTSVPADPWDVPVDLIVTEEKTISTAKGQISP